MNAITIDQLTKKVSLGRSTIYRLIAEGKFPKPFQLVPNRNAWIEDDIDRWLEAKADPECSGSVISLSSARVSSFETIMHEANTWEDVERCRRYLAHIEATARNQQLSAKTRAAIVDRLRSLRQLCDSLDPTEGRVKALTAPEATNSLDVRAVAN